MFLTIEGQQIKTVISLIKLNALKTSSILIFHWFCDDFKLSLFIRQLLTVFCALGIVWGSRTKCWTKVCNILAFIELKIQVSTDNQPKNFTNENLCLLVSATKEKNIINWEFLDLISQGRFPGSDEWVEV